VSKFSLKMANREAPCRPMTAYIGMPSNEASMDEADIRRRNPAYGLPPAGTETCESYIANGFRAVAMRRTEFAMCH
jgi:hypothetical protein